jgi:predicted signal transduction protein with EAL and GGDEF domain
MAGACACSPPRSKLPCANRAIERALQASSFEDELSIVLQPIIALDTGHLGGVEVLARWTNPHLGEISATEFIAIAERSTAIHSITRAVFRKG